VNLHLTDTLDGQGHVLGSYDLVLEGGLFGSRRSLNNCSAANHYATSLPVDLARFDCTHATTANPNA